MKLWAITTYYNPCRFKTRRDNYDAFVKDLAKSGVQLITIECAFNGERHELDGLNVIKVRSNSLLWQKERLLNMAASWLPKSCEYVAWLDCDIIFKNPNWATDTVRLLKENAVVQLFERCIKSDKGNVVNDACETSISFAKITSPDPVKFLNFERYDVHGHTGFGWAMRREIFDEVGLYEHAISGSADHFMAHAIYGHCGFCIQNALKHDKAQLDHFNEWAARFYPLVKGKLGCVPGDIIHLWHGDLADRRYFKRMHDITDLGFNPYFDIVSEPGKPLSWHPEFNKQGLKDYFYEYFYSRREDGRQDAKR